MGRTRDEDMPGNVEGPAMVPQGWWEWPEARRTAGEGTSLLAEREMRLGERVVARHGDCYEAAGRYFMDEALDADKEYFVLVHGEVRGQGSLAGVRFGHAWVENGDMVIDKSNGRDVRMPKAAYYALGDIRRTARYTAKEFRQRVLRYKHWGPWDLKTAL